MRVWRLLLYPLLLVLLVGAAILADLPLFWRVLLIGIAPGFLVWGLEGGPRLVLAFGLLGPVTAVGLGSGVWWALGVTTLSLGILELSPAWSDPDSANDTHREDGGGTRLSGETILFLLLAGVVVLVLVMAWTLIPRFADGGWVDTLDWDSALGLAVLGLGVGSLVWSLRALRG